MNSDDDLVDLESAEASQPLMKRKQTLKGKEYQTQLYQDQRSSAQRNWRKQLNKIENCLADSTNPAKLQSERMFLEAKMDILIAVQERLDEVLDDFEVKRVAQQKFEIWEQEHSEALKRLNQRITDLKQDEESSLPSGKSTPSRSSRTSQKSRKSHSSARIDRKVNTAARVAKLKTEISFADGEATKIAELKKFKLTKELAIAEAEMNAINKVEENELAPNGEKEDLLPHAINRNDLLHNYLTTQTSSVDKDSNLTMETELSDTPKPSSSKASPANDQTHHNETEVPINEGTTDAGSFVTRHPSTLNPFAPEYVTMPTPKRAQFTSTPYAQCKEWTPDSMRLTQDQGRGSPSQTNGDILQRLADLMTQRHAQESLPLPEPETFRGDLLHYPTWKKSFDTIIERRTDSSTQRLYYLGKYTSGEAKESIRSLLSLDSADAYNEARKIWESVPGRRCLPEEINRMAKSTP